MDFKKNIYNIFDSMVYDRSYYEIVSDFFEMSAIAIRNAVDLRPSRETYEERYLQTAKHYKPEQLQKFSQALAILQKEISSAVDGNAAFADWAGEIYMESKTSNSNLGQFFTPYHVSKVVALCGLDISRISAKIAADPDTVITIGEPTCGAGGLIVAAIEELSRQNINYAWNVFVDCGDIDARCVHMTYLTLSLLGVPAVVRRGDALMLKYTEDWFTPAYIFAYPHFAKRIGQSGYPKSPTVVKSTSQPPTAATAIEPTPTAIEPPKIDKTGQYLLF